MFKYDYDLTNADFERHPVWRYMWDEPIEATTNSTRIKPYDGVISGSSLLRDEVLSLVKTTFTSRAGKQYRGFSSPSAEFALDRIGPTVVLDDGTHIPFWLGTTRVRSDAKALANDLLGKLGDPAPFPFVAKYEVDMPLTFKRYFIPGFMAMHDGIADEHKEDTFDYAVTLVGH